MFVDVGDWEPEGQGEHGARVWCPDILQEGQWHHLVVVLNRAVLKNSSFSLYLDGQQIHNQKMHYISQNPGGGSANLTVASSVYGYIGSPPSWRRYSRLCWKQGPCHLFEEVNNLILLFFGCYLYLFSLGFASNYCDLHVPIGSSLYGIVFSPEFKQPRSGTISD